MSQWSAGSNASREENDVNGQPQEAHKARDALILRDGDDLGSADENNVVQQDDRRCDKDTVQSKGSTNKMLHPVEDVVGQEAYSTGCDNIA